MAHPAPFVVRTPPPSPKKTAKKLGVSTARFIHVTGIVDRVTSGSDLAPPRKQAGAKRAAERRSPRKK